MSRVAAIQTSFNGGELSPRLRGRVDQAVYQIGTAELLGWVPLVQGPATADTGTRFVAVAKGPHRLIPFEYNVTQGYVIEASAGALRFYTNDVRIETAPDVPYELASPWSYDQVRALDYAADRDVVYFVHGAKRSKLLRRLTATTFDLIDLAFDGGPFEDRNSDQALTVTASGTTGTVALTASAPLFAAGDVGGLFQIDAPDFASVPAWEPGLTVASGDKRSWSGSVYVCAGGGTRTGSRAPTHLAGTEWDGSGAGTDINAKGPYGVRWTYLYGRSGHGRITAVADATHATLEVVVRLADEVAAGSNWRWAFGAFSDRRGWPSAVTIWNGRLVLGKGARLYGSVVGDYGGGRVNFAAYDEHGDAQRDLAFQSSLPNPNDIRWLAADRLLLVGTARAEHTVEQLQVNSDAAGPPILNVSTQSTYGTATVKPVLADGRVLFVQRAGRKILEMGYSLSTDRYEAPDLTRFAEHLGLAGFRELAWQQEPERLLWAVRDDGTLACLTYSPAQQVLGWARRELGGGLMARSACAITDPAGTRDQLWLGVEADDGAWWVLAKAPLRELGDAPEDAFFVDAGLSYAGAPVAAVGGLDHLAGRTAAVLADGKPHPEVEVSGAGTATLAYAASRIHVGLAYPARLRTLPPEAGGDDGTAQTKMRRIPRVALRVLETSGVRIAVQDQSPQAIETRLPSMPMNQRVPLWSGDLILETGGVYERGGALAIERFQPLPATLLAIVATTVVAPT